MGRHYRDEEPVPHPQDRTPRVPAEGRSEASGAFRTPGRSSISDAFGIARVPGESSGSVFFTEGAQAPGFPPAPDGPATRRGETSGAYPAASGSHPVTRRGEASGSYPVAGGDSAVTRAPRRSEASGAHPVTSSEITTTIATRRGETSGAYPVTNGEAASRSRRGETSGAYPVAHPETTRRGEASGSYPAAESATRSQRRGEATGAAESATRAPRRGEAAGAHPVTDTTRTRRGEASGAYPVTNGKAASRSRLGEASDAHPVTNGEATGTTPRTRRGETTGAHPVTDGEAAETTSRSRRKDRGAPVPDRVETPGSGRSTRASRRAEATGAHPVTPVGEGTSPRSRRRGGKAPAESAAERTEVITPPDEDVATRPEDTGTGTGPQTPGRGERTDSTGPQRAGREDSTGPNRTPRSEGTGSHRIVGKSDATGSHRIVGKKAPRRRIAGWPIACLVLAVLIGLGVVGWNWADNELNSRAEAQAASCDGGTTHMRVVVTPSVQKPVAAAADRWNQAATVVHGQCVHVMIEAKPSAQVLDALVGRAKLDSIGGLPAAWLPESSYWVSELTTKKPEMIGSPAQSVANARSADYPFIGLAGPGVDDTALRAAQTFREYLEQPAQQADFAAAGIKST
ncbi:hypothetical protein [Amycolatopsis sp. NPDC003861]